ncbi:hypothetical protein [Paraburkholderia kururiensis]|uniref:hypothetical protein n=1 Tax=Paraburkholderia kururiensis TaxID=984307 RepID=UPI0005AA70CA|nr:hypothetical protein [Paraburkholderia kururiensis]
MKPISEFQKMVVHTLAVFGPGSKVDVAMRADMIAESVKQCVRKLIPMGYVEQIGMTYTKQKRSPLYRWTGKDYGEPPAGMFEREIAMKVAAAAIDAMCRVG